MENPGTCRGVCREACQQNCKRLSWTGRLGHSTCASKAVIRQVERGELNALQICEPEGPPDSQKKTAHEQLHQVGVNEDFKASSHKMRIRIGKGIASLRSFRAPEPLTKLLIKTLLRMGSKCSTKAVFASHLKPRKMYWGCNLLAWTSFLEASLARCKISTRNCRFRSCQSMPKCLIQVQVVAIARE